MKQIFTPKDAAIILRDTPIDIRSARQDDIHTIYATAMMMAIEVLEDVDKYRWHDLRKDPEELPDAENGESDTVLCQKKIGTYILLYFDGGNWCYPTGECYECNKDYQKIIAWKEIEPFVPSAM